MYKKNRNYIKQFILKLHPRKEELAGCIILLIATLPLFGEGHITFSDMSFGKKADLYMNFVVGIFNENLSSPNWFNLPRIVWLLVPYLISQVFENSGHVLLVSLIYGIFFVSSFSFGTLMRRFAKECNIHLSDWTILAGILAYTLNPWVLLRIQHTYLLCGYALTPFCFSWTWRLLGKEGWDKSNFKILPSLSEILRFLLLGIAVSASFAGVHFGIFIILTMIGITLLFAGKAFLIAVKRKRIVHWFCWYALRGGILGACFLIFALYWIAPFILSILEGIRPSQNNINAVETVVMLSRASAVQNVLTGISYWWPMFDHSKLPALFWIGGYSLWIFVLIGIWSSKRFLLTIFLLAILTLTTGTHFSVLAPTYISLVFDSVYPFGDMLRDPNKLYGVAILPISIFFCLGIERSRHLVSKKASMKAALKYFIIAILCFWMLPVYRIYMMGYYKPVLWSPEYDELQAEIEKLPENAKVLYLPVADFAVDKNVGFSSPDFNRTEIQGKEVQKATSSFLTLDSRRDTFFPFEGNDTNIFYFIWFIHHLLEQENIHQLGSLVAKAGITHIVVRKDYKLHYERFEKYAQQLAEQDDLEMIWTNEKIHLFEVSNAKADVDSLEQLTYTTGGFERLIWFPRALEDNLENMNFIFGYDGHYSPLSSLKKGDIVETSSMEDLLLSTLPPEQYTFPADGLRSGTPHLRWSKLIISGDDWDHYAHHYGISSRDSAFDLGRGMAFTITPLEVPQESFINPNLRKRQLEKELKQPELFFHSFENTEKIKIISTSTPDSASGYMKIALAADDNKDNWQMLESEFFELQENMLYHMVATNPRKEKLNLQVRIGFYSKNGNRLGTETTETIILLPEPLEKTNKRSFLSPPGTVLGRLEIRAQNPNPNDIAFTINNLSLFSLENMASPNTLSFNLFEKDFSEKGTLWIRLYCSTEGGKIKIQSGDFSAIVDTTCKPNARFIWKGVPTEEGFSPNIDLINIQGVNAINTVTWTSESDWKERKQALKEQLSDKNMAILIDSTEMRLENVIEDSRFDSSLIGGTFARGLHGSLESTINIITSGSYTLTIPDLLPFDKDSYQISLSKIELNEQDEESSLRQIISRNINQNSAERRTTSSDPRHGRTIIENLELTEGRYRIIIKLKSSQSALLDWKSLAFLSKQIPDLAKQTQISSADKSVSYYIPAGNTNWGPLQTQTIPITEHNPLLINFNYKTDGLRDLHGKLHFFDQNDQLIKSVFLSKTYRGDENFRPYILTVSPPEYTSKISFQALARHRLNPMLDANFTIQDLNIYEANKTIGIDGILLIEEPKIDEAKTNSSIVSDISVSRGERRFSIKNPSTGSEPRIQFFEAPIHHWRFNIGEEQLAPFAINGISFGMNLPDEKDISIHANIYLNSIWQKGVYVWILGVLAICVLALFQVILSRRIVE